MLCSPRQPHQPSGLPAPRLAISLGDPVDDDHYQHFRGNKLKAVEIKRGEWEARFKTIGSKRRTGLA